jgi:hypothetical protein
VANVLPRIHFIPYSLIYWVPLFLKRQCDRTLRQGLRGPAERAVGGHARSPGTAPRHVRGARPAGRSPGAVARGAPSNSRRYSKSVLCGVFVTLCMGAQGLTANNGGFDDPWAVARQAARGRAPRGRRPPRRGRRGQAGRLARPGGQGRKMWVFELLAEDPRTPGLRACSRPTARCAHTSEPVDE